MQLMVAERRAEENPNGLESARQGCQPQRRAMFKFALFHSLPHSAGGGGGGSEYLCMYLYILGKIQDKIRKEMRLITGLQSTMVLLRCVTFLYATECVLVCAQNGG
jgi:hypothetical protein